MAADSSDRARDKRCWLVTRHAAAMNGSGSPWRAKAAGLDLDTFDSWSAQAGSYSERDARAV